jgi:SAM-dependent methyltransferase
MTNAPEAPTQIDMGRAHLARHLYGQGIEVGPGSSPFPLPPGATVQWVDRWTAAEARALYPEIPDAVFLDPDVVSNFDVDRLDMFESASLDFVIASHVLEHLAEPLGFLAAIHRVLKPGGLAVVLMPNRHESFDAERAPTSLDHLVREHEAGVTAVDDEHLEEFLHFADKGTSRTIAPEPDDDAAFYDWHRLRSIHVHCWNEAEFSAMLRYSVVGLGLSWEFVERLNSESPLEYGWLLRRSRLRGTWESIRTRA